MAGQVIYITEEEASALLAASDFISTNSDGADDITPFEDMQVKLENIFKKYKRRRDK